MIKKEGRGMALIIAILATVVSLYMIFLAQKDPVVAKLNRTCVECDTSDPNWVRIRTITEIRQPVMVDGEWLYAIEDSIINTMYYIPGDMHTDICK